MLLKEYDEVVVLCLRALVTIMLTFKQRKSEVLRFKSIVSMTRNFKASRKNLLSPAKMIAPGTKF